MLQRKNKITKLNKPINCGIKILDISKFHMYDIWYNLLKPEFKEDLYLILMDTDSFILAVKDLTVEQ